LFQRLHPLSGPQLRHRPSRVLSRQLNQFHFQRTILRDNPHSLPEVFQRTFQPEYHLTYRLVNQLAVEYRVFQPTIVIRLHFQRDALLILRFRHHLPNPLPFPLLNHLIVPRVNPLDNRFLVPLLSLLVSQLLSPPDNRPLVLLPLIPRVLQLSLVVLPLLYELLPSLLSPRSRRNQQESQR
jgi:hypothetical protein